ncbi:MAG: hypothetical protein AABY22_36480 [Nanoarchaeota archaeon]
MEKDEICPECGKVVVEDEKEVWCKGCGLVIREVVDIGVSKIYDKETNDLTQLSKPVELGQPLEPTEIGTIKKKL